MTVEVDDVEISDLAKDGESECSAEVKKRVNACREIQLKRLKEKNIYCNAKMTHEQIALHCRLSPECAKLMESAFNKLVMSARGYNRILKVARTIADLAGADQIGVTHLSESVQYRTLDKKYWI